jgi:formylglycine-generating enzyme required for sulfatase activity
MANDLRSLPIGQVISGYRIEGILGQGGFGITYLATDTKLMRQVAVKEYYPREYAQRDSTMTIRAAGDADDKETFAWGLSRFLTEAQLLARFEHPNIIAVRRFFEANGTAYLVMDYCDGRPLDDIIKRDGPVSQDQLEKILYPLLSGLEQVHGTGFLHRDIKPANLFIRADGSPVLLDFGAAIRVSSQHTRGVTTMVADGYSPVEQYDSNGKQGPYTDIYGLAATLYRAVTGEKPQASTGRILNDTLEPAVKKARGRYAENLLAAIDAGMAVRPENRPQSVAELRSLLAKSRPLTSTPRMSAPGPAEPAFTQSFPAPKPTLKQAPVSLPLPGQASGPWKPKPDELSPFKEWRSRPQDAEIHQLLVAAELSPFKKWASMPAFFLVLLIFFVAYELVSHPGANDNSEVAAAPPVKSEPTPTPVEASSAGASEFQDCDVCPVMRLLPRGTFTMGSSVNEIGHEVTEEPQHSATVESVYVGKFTVSQKEWNSCVAAGGCQGKRDQGGASVDQMPVTNVTWYDAQAYAAWLSKKAGKTYRLLSETEWEYAARAGSKTAYSFGSDESSLGLFAWHKGNAESQGHPVGTKLENAFGLHDMHGNVSQWTADCWNESYTGAPQDGSAWTTGNCNGRVLRGGSWDDGATGLRSAARGLGIMEFRSESVGFRLATNGL